MTARHDMYAALAPPEPGIPGTGSRRPVRHPSARACPRGRSPAAARRTPLAQREARHEDQDPAGRHQQAPENDWLQTDGWLAELRDDSRADPAGDGHARPAHGSDPWPEILAEADARAQAEADARAQAAEADARAEAAARGRGARAQAAARPRPTPAPRPRLMPVPVPRLLPAVRRPLPALR